MAVGVQWRGKGLIYLKAEMAIGSFEGELEVRPGIADDQAETSRVSCLRHQYRKKDEEYKMVYLIV